MNGGGAYEEMTSRVPGTSDWSKYLETDVIVQ